MRNDRLDEEDLLVNGPIGGERLSKSERQTLRREAGELKRQMEAANEEPIRE